MNVGGRCGLSVSKITTDSYWRTEGSEQCSADILGSARMT